MPVTMICPNLKCGRTIITPDNSRGKVMRCAHCDQPFVVPGPPQPPPEPAAAGTKPGKK
ncbi:hypothetical protein RAS1_06490 [Phycisphaerae bacterium RAS1]|nr:hypothetical protein RAS1_06490 [Phycisphaerae bacterium RAS1]